MANGEAATTATAEKGEARSLRELSPQQWRSGAAAWLGWMFDGLDMHLYLLVAMPFVAELLGKAQTDPDVAWKASLIQASFLVGWALGGGLFGWVGDRFGRSRTLALTILTYATFTGLSYFVTDWRQLLACRFVAALGIGGEWAVGAALLAESWPKAWRPWLAAVLQTGVNIGVVTATLAVLALKGTPPRTVFLIGVLPALMVFWVRRAVPETDEWHAAKAAGPAPSVLDLFAPGVRRTTLLTIGVCGLALTGHWAFMFWSVKQLTGLPELAAWERADRDAFGTVGFMVINLGAILGNFLGAAVAKGFGFRPAVVAFCAGYGVALGAVYCVPRTPAAMLWLLLLPGMAQGVFALCTMYLPPLFPTLLRTTGAGFCYNIGRLMAAAGTVVFGLVGVGDMRLALLGCALLFVPAAALACLLPDARRE